MDESPKHESKDELKQRLRNERSQDYEESKRLQQTIKETTMRDRQEINPASLSQDQSKVTKKQEEAFPFIANSPWEVDDSNEKTNKRVVSSGGITDESDEKIAEGASRRVHLSRGIVGKEGPATNEAIARDIDIMGAALRYRPYKELGIQPGSSPDQVKAAYEGKVSLAKTDDERMILKKTYDFLSDPQTKQSYDQTYSQLLQVKKLERQDRQTSRTQPQIYEQAVKIDEKKRLDERELDLLRQKEKILNEREQQKAEIRRNGANVLEPLLKQLKQAQKDGRRLTQDELKVIGGKTGGLLTAMAYFEVDKIQTPLGSLNYHVTGRNTVGNKENIDMTSWISDEFGNKLL